MRGVYISYKAQQLENDISRRHRLARDGQTVTRTESALGALTRLILTLIARQ